MAPDPPTDPGQLSPARYIIGSISSSMGKRAEGADASVITFRTTVEMSSRDIATIQAGLSAQPARMDALETEQKVQCPGAKRDAATAQGCSGAA